MYSTENGNDLLECPYDKSHRILRKRFQIHLLRCRKNHPNAELQKCPFNVTHLIPEPEYVYHVTGCPDRKLITQYERRVEEDIVIRHTYSDDDDEENWDECDAPDFKFEPKRNITRDRIKSRSRSPLSRTNNETEPSSSQHRRKSDKRVEVKHDLDDDPYYTGEGNGV